MKSQEVITRYVNYLMDDKRIFRKACECLIDIASLENIEIILFPNTETLTKWAGTSELIAGMYRYTKKDDECITNKSTIGIAGDLKDSSNIFVLSHELGHHFSIKKRKDRSEKSANSYIQVLFRKILKDFEYNLIQSTILIYSGHNVTYEKPIEGYVYLDFNILCQTRKELQRKLRKEAQEILKTKKRYQIVKPKWYSFQWLFKTKKAAR